MLSYLLFIAAIIGTLFFPNIIIVHDNSAPIRLGTICDLYIIISIAFFIYRRRELPFFGKLWNLISLFFTVLLAVLLGGYIREQWKKKDNTALFFGLLLPFLWFVNTKSQNKKALNRK